MPRPTWSEQLKDPRWQKKRLEVLEQAAWSCQHCGAQEKTLEVHHGYYEKDIQPWEYENQTLHVLCSECHSEIGALYRVMKGHIGLFSLREMYRLWGYIEGVESQKYGDGQCRLYDNEVSQGIADAFGISRADLVTRFGTENMIDARDLESFASAIRRKAIIDE